MREPRFPEAADEDRFWDMVEAAWAPLDSEINQARQALTSRDPSTDDGYAPLSVIDGALKAFLANLNAAAQGLSAGELTDLDRVVERKLYDIDRADIQAVTDGSDDGFLYARGFIVALGRDFYAAVVRDPAMAVLDADCEGMCYLFAHLHRKRLGDFPDAGSGITRESCSNPAGWPT